MKYLKKIKKVLAIVPILCVMSLFTAYGQDSTIGEFTVTEYQGNDINKTYYIVGKDGEKEVKTSGIYDEWFDKSVTVKIAYNLLRGTGDGVIVENHTVEVIHDGKLYQIIIIPGVKLKYELIDEKAIIMFDESYFLPIEE